MTAVRKIRQQDQQPLRSLAYQNYLATHRPPGAGDENPPDFEVCFRQLTGLHRGDTDRTFVAERNASLVGLVCLPGSITMKICLSCPNNYPDFERR